MLHFIRDHAESFHIVGMIGYVLILFWIAYVGMRMVHRHHVIGRPRALVAAAYLPAPTVALTLAVFLYCGAGAVAHPVAGAFLILLAVLVWFAAVLLARRRFAPYAAADLEFPQNV
jgi:hypothetical protein